MRSDAYRAAIVTAGGVAPLVALALDGDAVGKENAAWALANLASGTEACRDAIFAA